MNIFWAMIVLLVLKSCTVTKSERFRISFHHINSIFLNKHKYLSLRGRSHVCVPNYVKFIIQIFVGDFLA